MERSKNQTRILNLSRKDAVQIPSGHGRGVGTTPAGAADARKLASESAARSLRVARAQD